MVELEVVDIVMQPQSEERHQRWRDSAEAVGAPPGFPIVDAGGGPRVRLRERDGGRVLSIAIGTSEAIAINLAMQGVTTPRPMTHDFICSL